MRLLLPPWLSLCLLFCLYAKMARKKPLKYSPPPPSSDEEEDQNGGLGENGPVEEVEREDSSDKGRELISDTDKDSENTAPSPNVSGLVIEPIVYESPLVAKPSSKRAAESEASGTLVKKEKLATPAIVLGLSKQNNFNEKKMAFRGCESGKLKDKKDTKRSGKMVKKHPDNVDSKSWSELLSEEMFRFGIGNGLAVLMKEKMGGIQSKKAEEIDKKWKKLQQRMLEMYIKRLELVQYQTKLVLDELKASK